MEDRRASPVSEDAGIMSMQELQLLDENHTDGAISDEKLAKILERLKVAMSDLELNTFTCCVCDLFKKRKFFIKVDLQAKKKATVLMKHMQEVLHFSDVNPPLPPYLVQEFVPLWEARPHLDGLLLSINGFQNPTPPSNPNAADFAYICTCHDCLKKPVSNNKNPPKYALANHLCIGKCPLPELTPMQHKMLALITTRSEVVVYRYVADF